MIDWMGLILAWGENDIVETDDGILFCQIFTQAYGREMYY